LEGSPLKNLGCQKHAKFARFFTTSDFDRECLRNETRYQKSERHVISSDSSHVQPNKSGELWSTIHKVVHVSLDPPKSTFSTNYISAPRGCWLLKFLYALEFDQTFVPHFAIGVGGPLKNFKGQHLKLGLKFYICTSITLGVVGISGGDQLDTNFTRGVPYKIWEGKKRPKFSAIFNNFRV